MTDSNLEIGPFRIGWEFIFRMLTTASMLVAMLWLLTAQMSELRARMVKVQSNQQLMREDIVALKTSLVYIEHRVDTNARSRSDSVTGVR